MRIGVNIPNELIERLKPLRSTHNISEICREALRSYIESYEKTSQGKGGDEVAALANGLYQQYAKKTPRVDWEAIGRENAKKWAEGASLQDFEDVIHNISIHRGKGAEPGEFLGLGGYRKDADSRIHRIGMENGSTGNSNWMRDPITIW